jgi:hypothetical protein
VDISEFLEDNGDLPHEGFSWGRVVFVSDGNRIALHLHLSEKATIDAIRRGWGVISEWRRRLTAWQGASPSDSWESLWQWGLDHFAQRGTAYRQLANGINETVVELLRKHLEETQDCERARWRCKSEVDLLRWRLEHQCLGVHIRMAADVLRCMGISEVDVMEWGREAVPELVRIDNLERQNVISAEKAKRQRAAIARNGPIKRKHIISRVEAWRDRARPRDVYPSVGKTG